MDNGNFRRSQLQAENKLSKNKYKFIPKPIKRIWKKYNLSRVLLLAITIFLILVTGYLYFLSKVTNVSILEQSLYQQTQIIDNKGQVADKLSGDKGSTLTYNEIPDNVKNAVVATEDRTFYTNHGVNYTRTILAMLTAGHFGGGSTITQQLAKNSYLSQAQTIDRKAREIFLALQITKKYSKDDILTMYLNSNGYGNGVIGIQDASHKYFAKDAANLTLGEAATLVGMLKGPAIYNPIYSIANATNRRDTVISNMVVAGYINQATAEEAKSENLGSEVKDDYASQEKNPKYPSYDNAVIAEAEKTYGLSSSDVLNSGYKIYTGMNQAMQSGLQESYSSSSAFPVADDGVMAQSGTVALDPKTGEALAVMGNSPVAGYSSLTDFNFAMNAKRSPGSVIKPLIVYAPAIEAGWAIDKTVHDVPTTYDGNWSPQNADGNFHGDMPMYQALANSYNIPAINTYKEIGPSTGNALGKKFGLNLTSENNVLPTSLGAGVETNPWQIAQAYQVFANGGLMETAHLITKIEDASGRTIKTAKVNQIQVINVDSANKMTQMMLGTYSNGTGAWAGPKDYTLAGKTGTNEDIDQWVVGYTPDIVMAEWLGFSNPQPVDHRLDGTSEIQASYIFRTSASYILPYTKGTKFTVDNPYVTANIPPIYPAWTYLRQFQDGIVNSEEGTSGTGGNQATSSSSSASKTFTDDVKNIWNKFTNLFK
ncbi:PBP1A family penicillin-binding protein [Lactovum miscens]|uniref:Penicillin-binding protein 2A n=1 Tax=Lactovum miscens TaxID=190387 RepID=A0A841C3H4_9LACT|nr:PBP1A family penicillin-binding protein [Lactovum miscens]MBB5888506.1 penicillin-binding protein 2A [Lactovum miscens]